MERREFLKNCAFICTGGATAGLLLRSCTPVHVVTGTREKDILKVKKSEFLNKKGERLDFIVVRDTQLSFPVCVYLIGEAYVALSAECTHKGCELQANKVSLICPCHGSEFSKEGKVLSPPADKDLKRFIVTTDDENIFIKL